MKNKEVLSISEENYLKQIFYLSQFTKDPVNTNDIAARMKTRAASVTDMLKKLKAKKLIKYVPYAGVHLTIEGRERAVFLVRKHRLWEVFLADKLDFKWDEIHEIAEQLEHIESIELIRRIDKFLGYPKQDPHGDPIPDEKGNFRQKKHLSLLDCNENETVIVVGVRDSNKEFLQFLGELKIGIGTKIRVDEILGFDDSRKVIVLGKKLLLSSFICKNILIE